MIKEYRVPGIGTFYISEEYVEGGRDRYQAFTSKESPFTGECSNLKQVERDLKINILSKIEKEITALEESKTILSKEGLERFVVKE